MVFISHKLNEVKQICDDLTVLRRGKVVWGGEAKGVGTEELAEHMVGRAVTQVRAHEGRAAAGQAVLELPGQRERALRRFRWRWGRRFSASPEWMEMGSRSWRKCWWGCGRWSRGRYFSTVAMCRRWGSGIAELGHAHIPNDRKREGLVGAMGIAENIALKHHARPPYSAGPLVVWRQVRRATAGLIKLFDIRAAGVDAPVGRLSGGNQQKVILARELAVVKPKLIVAMNPVRGLDIAATNFVYEQLLKHREDGCAIILISSELDELLRLCDRIAVLYRGTLTLTDFPNSGAREIGQLMGGIGTEHSTPPA